MEDFLGLKEVLGCYCEKVLEGSFMRIIFKWFNKILEINFE